jgi:predicted nucleic acid-binding protein
MILIDASIIIEYLQTQNATLLSVMQTNQAAICGVTRAEVLSGSRHPKHRQRLDTLDQISLSDSFWDVVGDHVAELRSNGVTVPFPDAVLSALSLSLDVELWSRDQHFAHIQRVIPALKLFQEPP